jgi:hypothetical protein
MTNKSVKKAVLQTEYEIGLSLNPDPIPDLVFYDQNFKNMYSEKNPYISNMTFLQFIHFRDLLLPQLSRDGGVRYVREERR